MFGLHTCTGAEIESDSDRVYLYQLFSSIMHSDFLYSSKTSLTIHFSTIMKLIEDFTIDN